VQELAEMGSIIQLCIVESIEN